MQEENKKFYPTKIKAPVGAALMNIYWADGHVSILPNEFVRGNCPCAHCQGHGGNTTFISGVNSEILSIEKMGNYALKFTWGDNHDTGIYSFERLRKLCQCEECKNLTS